MSSTKHTQPRYMSNVYLVLDISSNCLLNRWNIRYNSICVPGTMYDDINMNWTSILEHHSAIFTGTFDLHSHINISNLSTLGWIAHRWTSIQGPNSPEIRAFTIEWSHILSYPGCFLEICSVSDLFAIWTSFADLAISLEISTALAELPITTTTCQKEINNYMRSNHIHIRSRL